MENIKQSVRIQTSVLNGVERKVLVWLAKRLPAWVSPDMLTMTGTLGAMITGLGFWLTRYDISWLWLSSAGLLINWYGDSLDGTLARVRNCQRPLYGYYLDHTIDCINEAFMFVGVGLSPAVNLNLAIAAFILYLFMTINVSINTHLKGEFRLTYAKMGPTELRIIIILMNTILVAFPSIAFRTVTLAGLQLTIPNVIVGTITLALAVIYICTITSDARKYAKIDPKKKGTDHDHNI